MSHAKRKVEWCLKKASRELEERGVHRGLVLTKPDVEKARRHIQKAEHYLKATDYLKAGSYSDISASTVFYSMYHCLLAVGIKFGYESRNQECTFALMHALAEENKIHMEKSILDKIALLDVSKDHEKSILSIRELYQYGTGLSLEEDLYEELFSLARELLSQTKEMVES